MVVVCDKCGAKFKLTIKKTPSKPISFKCGKCAHQIQVLPEQLAVDAESKPAAPGTVAAVCAKCGASFVKPATEKTSICYQCRIDSLVAKVRDKYGVGAKPEGPAPGDEPPEPPPEPAPAPEPRYTLRTADGLVLGPIKLRTVAVLAREKRIRGVEEVAKDDCAYQPLMRYPELAEFFPELKEIMDTSGLEDRVEEAFMAAFKDEEEPACPAGAAPPEPAPEPSAPSPEPPAPEPAPIPEPAAAAPPPPEPQPGPPLPEPPLAPIAPDDSAPVAEAIYEPPADQAEPAPEAPPEALPDAAPEPEPAPEAALEPASEAALEPAAELPPEPEPPPSSEPDTAFIGDPDYHRRDPAAEEGGDDSEAVIDWAAGGGHHDHEHEHAPEPEPPPPPEPPPAPEEAAPPLEESAPPPEPEPAPPSEPEPASEAAPATVPEPEPSPEPGPAPPAASEPEPPPEPQATPAEAAAPTPPPESSAEEGLEPADVVESEVGTEFEVDNEEAEPEELEEAEIIEGLEPIVEPPPDTRYRIRYPDGLILGPVKLLTIRELFDSGNVTGQEDVQRGDEPWLAFAELPELADLVTAAEADEGVIELTDTLEEV